MTLEDIAPVQEGDNTYVTSPRDEAVAAEKPPVEGAPEGKTLADKIPKTIEGVADDIAPADVPASAAP